MCINQIRGIKNQSEKIFDIPPPAPNVFFFVNSTHSFILTLCTYYTVEMYYSTVQIVDCHCLYVCQSTVHHCLLRRSDVVLFIHSCPHKIIISVSSAIKLFILTYCTVPMILRSEHSKKHLLPILLACPNVLLCCIF